MTDNFSETNPLFIPRKIVN